MPFLTGFNGLGTASGRICDGYDPLPANTEPRFIVVVPSLVRREESRSLQYFYEKTVSQMTTFFRDEFWTRHVMQVADSHKCIRHSLVALSSYHESFSSPKPASRNQFALRHYNMSIGGILGSLRTADNAHIHLMSCILFICIEVRAVVADIKARKLRSHLIGIARTHIDGSATCQSWLQNSPRTKQKPTGDE